jgi:hypothetical protein
LRLILQRQLQGDGRSWRSVIWFRPKDQNDVTEVAKLLTKIDLVNLRIVVDPIEANAKKLDIVAIWDDSIRDWKAP